MHAFARPKGRAPTVGQRHCGGHRPRPDVVRVRSCITDDELQTQLASGTPQQRNTPSSQPRAEGHVVLQPRTFRLNPSVLSALDGATISTEWWAPVGKRMVEARRFIASVLKRQRRSCQCLFACIMSWVDAAFCAGGVCRCSWRPFPPSIPLHACAAVAKRTNHNGAPERLEARGGRRSIRVPGKRRSSPREATNASLHQWRHRLVLTYTAGHLVP